MEDRPKGGSSSEHGCWGSTDGVTGGGGAAGAEGVSNIMAEYFVDLKNIINFYIHLLSRVSISKYIDLVMAFNKFLLM